MSSNSFGARRTLGVGGASYDIFRLDRVRRHGAAAVQPESPAGKPAAQRGRPAVTAEQVAALASWDADG